MKKLFVVVCLMFIYGISSAGLSVDPAIVNINGEPLTGYDGKYTVKNTYDYPITVIIKTEDWNTYTGNSDVDVNKWLKFEKEKYPVSAGESIEVPYKIEIAKDMIGSVSGRVNFSVEQQEGQMVTISISVPIYITVKGTEKIDFKIDAADLAASVRGINYKIVVKNDGNVHVRPSGSIEIYDKKKKKLITTVSIPETVPAYALQSRDFTGLLVGKNGLKKGKYTAVFKVKALGQEASKEIKFKVSKLGEVVTQ